MVLSLILLIIINHSTSKWGVEFYVLYILEYHVFLTRYCLEQFLTLTVWWAIPVIWLPVVCWFVYNSVEMGLSCPHIALMVVLGIFVWTFLEYTLHRFLFHIKTKTYWLDLSLSSLLFPSHEIISWFEKCWQHIL